METIKDKKLTTGLFYDEDGNEESFTSGEKDDAARQANDVLDDVGIPREPRAKRHAVAAHVEVKVAAQMREARVRYGVLVINNPSGICQGVGGGTGCQDVLRAVLPVGAILAVWTPLEIQAGRHEAVMFVGIAP